MIAAEKRSNVSQLSNHIKNQSNTKTPALIIPMLQSVLLYQQKYEQYKTTALSQEQIYEQQINIHDQKDVHIAYTINLYGIYRPNIIKQIATQFKDFPNLQELNLCANKIASIEQLQKINFPNLLQLYLDQNQIYSLKPLQKVNFPKLDWLMISKNRVIELESLSRMHTPVLGAITLQKLYDNQKAQAQVDATRTMLKMKTKSLNFISIAAMNRKKWGQLDGILRKKYKSLRIQRLNQKQQFLVI